MLVAIVLTLFLTAPFLIWQFYIRPYCLKKGKAYTTGASWAVTMWVDWQEAKALARTDRNRLVTLACGAFLWIQISSVLMFILAIFASG